MPIWGTAPISQVRQRAIHAGIAVPPCGYNDAASYSFQRLLLIDGHDEPYELCCYWHVSSNGGLPLARLTNMTSTETYRYRGYDIVPDRQWSQWCVSIYATRADLPLISRSTLRTLAFRKEEAVAEAKQCIDRLLHL